MAQAVPDILPPTVPAAGLNAPAFLPDVVLPVMAPLPRMAPELALQLFTQRSATQPDKLSGYSDTTIVEAELPDTAQKGEYELIRNFTAPHTLSFSTVKFTGDSFVKTNVIVRLLQQEVDHAQKENPSETAFNGKNYKFSYKGQENVDGNLCHVYQLKPRRKVPGLFKGRIYVDVYTASLHRAEGTLLKSPSFFVKDIEFVQDFADVGGFTFPTHLRSTAKARIIGRAVVNILHRGYKYEANALTNPVDPGVLGSTH